MPFAVRGRLWLRLAVRSARRVCFRARHLSRLAVLRCPPPMMRATTVAAATLQLLGLLARGNATCDVSCLSSVFGNRLPSAHVQHNGMPVCGNEGCGDSAPYVGLEDFGCSADETAFGGRCCNTATCAGAVAGQHPPMALRPPPAPPAASQENCPGAVGVCDQEELTRRAAAVTAECCDQPHESCTGGLPASCNAACASVLLPFWDDCEAALGASGDLFTEVIVECRASQKAAGVIAADGRAPYVLDTEYSGPTFGDDWNFFTDPDPTGGCVRFVDKDEALQKGLFGYEAFDGTFQIRADTTEVHHDCGSDARPAIRIGSKKRFHSGGLFSIDLDHMPSGCGTWPAFWLVAAPCGEQGACQWPVGGEIDIIEGANLNTRVATTLHTTNMCQMNPLCPDYPDMTGDFGAFLNCDGSGNGNMGCGIDGPEASYGEPLNALGGGVFVAEWLEEKISVWFFAHGQEPRDFTNGNPEPRGWGTPYASFPLGANCASTHFQDLQIVFDLTFCGGYAGNTYQQTCGDQPDSCRTASRASPADTECYAAVQAKRRRIGIDPFDGCLTSRSTDAEIQAVLFATQQGSCVRPCMDMTAACIPGVQTGGAAAAPACGPPNGACSGDIAWGLASGLREHPEWYSGSGLNPRSPRDAMQAWLYRGNSANCDVLPCNVASLNLAFDTGPAHGAAVTSPSGVSLSAPTDGMQRCNERVLWQPEAFTEAYWSINSVKVWQPTGRVQSCQDGEQNSGETGVDCGGPCGACRGIVGAGGTPTCGPPVAGTACADDITWGLRSGLREHPEWYSGSGLNPRSPRDAMQAWLYRGGNSNCDVLPCNVASLNLAFDAGPAPPPPPPIGGGH